MADELATTCHILAMVQPDKRPKGRQDEANAAGHELGFTPFDRCRHRRIALLGANGSGKTTLVESELSRALARAESVSYVPQDYRASLLPWLRVRENILLGQSPDPAGAIDLTTLTRELGLAESLLLRRVSQLSGGEKQLVAIARSLHRSPRTLFLDEPFSALDLGSRIQVRAAVAQRTHQLDCRLLLVTHDVDDALALCQSVILMRAPRGEPSVLDISDGSWNHHKLESACKDAFEGI